MTFPEEAPCWDSDPDEEPRRSALDEGGPVPDFAGALRNLDAAVLPPTTHAPALGIDGPAPADEPAPVPPPVDALLTEFDDAVNTAANGPSWPNERVERLRARVSTEATALWAAGVAEGHGLLDRAVVQEIEQRERAEEIADKLTAAIGRHLGVDFGEHSNLNDPWGRALIALAEADGGKFVKGAYEDGVAEGRRLLDETAATAAVHAYELGIAEGRRQATEERTEARCHRGRSCYACSLPIGTDDDYALVDVCGHMLCGKHQNDDHSCAADHG